MARRPKTPSDMRARPVSLTDLARLETLYSFRDRNTVVDWLEKYPFLVPLLFEAPSHIRKYFPDEPLFLEVCFDPEIAELTQLVAYIATDPDVDEAMERLDRLAEEWWLEVIDQGEWKMDVNIEFHGTSSEGRGYLEEVTAMNPALAVMSLAQKDLEQLERLYILRDGDTVIRFLEEHLFLLPELLEVPGKIQAHFPNAPLSLQLVLDPEEPGLDHLTVGIGTTLSVDEAMDQLDHFDEAWLPVTEPDVLMKLNIDVEWSSDEL